MKRFLFALLFLFSTSVFAQPVIDFETVGNNWVWNSFDLGTGGLKIFYCRKIKFEFGIH